MKIHFDLTLFSRTMTLFSTRIYVLLLTGLVMGGCKQEVFVECESFDDHGGWVVDPQFVEQVGSPYLMAHGLGEPVENASTTIQMPRSGTYNVWARTTNWNTAHGEAPGQFHIWLNRKQMEETLGVFSGWGWHYAGKMNLPGGPVLLELEDLTGFDGRCDAVYLCNRYRTPTNQGAYLPDLRMRFTGSTEVPDKEMEFDLVVVGGGIAGCAASIAAAEQGMKVALIHDRPVLGGNASSEVRVHTLGIYGYFERILRMLDTEHYPNGSPEAFRDEEKRQASVAAYPNISLFLMYRAYAAHTLDSVITSVDARHTETGEQIRFRAPYFVDCTGDGWIGYWAGADYRYGREGSDEFGEGWEEYGQLWCPDSADNKVMGASLLWRTYASDSAYEFPAVPWAMDVAKGQSGREGTWQWEMISEHWNQAENAEQIRDHLLKAIYGTFYNEKKKAGNENLKLEWVSYILGKRESRRLMGDYVFTFNDVRNPTRFPDAVVMEERAVDIHYRQDELDEECPDFLTEAMYYEADRYYVPYRSLYSRNIGNLFMAGRCFSCSHIGLGGPRVMRTTGQMGAAVGYAAALCNRYVCSPRELYEQYLEQYMDLVRSSDDPVVDLQ
jgi:hypothetical protein